MFDNPVNPAHYIKRGGVETIDYEEAVCADLPGDEAISVGNILKYVSRYRQKHPKDPVRDLKKARWYLDRLIDLVTEKERDAREAAEDAPEVNKMTGKPKANWAPQKLPEGTGVIVAKNRKEDEAANAVLFKKTTCCPDCGVGEGYLHEDNCPRLKAVKSDTDGWRDDYSNKGKPKRPPCPECGSETGHWMSCSNYSKHY